MDEKDFKSRIFPKIFWTFLIIFLIVFGVIFAKAYNVSTKIFGSQVSFFKRVQQLITHHGGTALAGEQTGQINILLLGYGGPGHDGPYLTDTIILASIKPDTKQILLSSVPRDYFWTSPSGEQQKINNAFADGVGRKINFQAGGEEARQAISELSGEQIPYFVSLDFKGFQEAIDQVGGVDVNVDRSFTDHLFPNDATNGYLPPQTFDAGPQHMDGERALIFARSRHAQGAEGSDFARSRRQEKIIAAFRDKVNSLNLIANASTYNSLLNILADHFHTNMEPDQVLHLAQLIKDGGYQTVSQSLDDSTGLVCNKILDSGAFVLEPCEGVTAANIQNFFQNGFNGAGLAAEHASIILENTGTDNALYQEIGQALKQAGVTVYEQPYHGIPLVASSLYEINSKPLTEHFIENKLGIAAQPKPAKMVAHADLVLFVGGPGTDK